MPTYARIHQLQSSLLYHVYSRGHRREEIYHKAADYQCFIRMLIDYKKRFSFKVYHWVLMPNHYHLLMEINEPENLSKLMAGLSRSYTHYYHKTYRTCGYLWQGRYKMQPVQKEKYLLACGRYIERNPVRAKIVQKAADFGYSSAAFYCRGIIDEVTDQNPYFEGFGVGEDRRRSYESFLANFNAGEEKLFNDLKEPQGDRKFVRRLVRAKGRYVPRRRGRPMTRIVL